MSKVNTALEVEAVDALRNIATALGDLDFDRELTVELGTETHNLISWLGDSLESIADTLKKIEAKMK